MAVQDAGWTMRTYTPPGFMSTTSSVRPYTTFCRGTEFATITYRATAEGDRLVRVAVGLEPDSSCAPMTGPMSDVPLPRFELPASVKSGGGSLGRRHIEFSRAARDVDDGDGARRALPATDAGDGLDD